MEKYTYSSLLDDFIRFEYEEKYFDKTLNGVFVWAYLRTFVYNIVRDRKVARQITHTTPIVPGVSKMSLFMKVEKRILRNILFAHKKDALIVSHGRKIEDGEGYYRDWNTGIINEKMELSHYLLDRSNTNAFFYPCRTHNILEYHLYQLRWLFRIKPQKDIVNKNDLYDNFLKPIEKHYDFSFSTREKNIVLGYAEARVRDNTILRAYVSYVLNKIRPRVVLLGMLTDSIMQVFCEVAHEMDIPTIYLQEGIMFEAIYCYYYKPRHNHNRFFADYLFCYGDYEKEMLEFLPIGKDHVVPVGFPDLEKYEKVEMPDASGKVRIMVISSGTNYLADVAGRLSELLDSSIYQVIYKLHPREIVNYDREIFPIIRKYDHLELIDAPSNDSNNNASKDRPFAKAYQYFEHMTWIVGTASAALFEATKFKKKIAIVDLSGVMQSPLLEKKAAIRVKNAEELADVIISDSFSPNFSFRFYCDNAVDNINSEIKRIIDSRSVKQ